LEIDMADETGSKHVPAVATDAAIKATGTSADADGRQEQPADPRLLPGGRHGAAVDPGMSSLDRDTVIGLGPKDEP
jgi:hypothetical protein